MTCRSSICRGPGCKATSPAAWLAIRFGVIGVAMMVLLSVARSPAADREPLYRGQTLDTWFDWLRNGSDDVRLQAVTAIGEFGPESRARAAEFAVGLKDANRAVRLATSKQLGSWGADAKGAGLQLAKTLRDIDPEVADSAGVALGQIGEAVGDEARVEAVRAMEDRDEQVRRRADAAMSSVGWSAPAVAALAEVMDSKNSDVRHAATWKITGIPRDLVKPLRDKVFAQLVEDPGNLNILSAVDHVGADAEFVPYLAAAFESDDDEVRIAAVRAAGRFTELGKPFIGEIAGFLKDENERVRRAAAMALDKLEHHDARAVAVLIGMLAANEDEVETYEKTRVIDALGNLGPLAKEAVPQMLKCFAAADSPFDNTAWTMGKAIGKIGPDAVKQLAELLSARSVMLRLNTAKALDAMGPPVVDAVPQMAAFLERSGEYNELDARLHVIQTLRGLGGNAKAAAAALAAATAAAQQRIDFAEKTLYVSSNESIELALLAETWWCVEGDENAVKKLVGLLKNGNNSARAYAVAAIYRSVGHPPKPVVEPLLRILGERIEVYSRSRDSLPIAGVSVPFDVSERWKAPDESEVTDMAIAILSRFGSDAKPALASIKRIAAEDADPAVVRSAAEAWWTIEPGEEPVKAVVKSLKAERFGKNDAYSRSLVIQNTVYALESMGDHAKAVVPELVDAYKQCDDEEDKAVIGGLLKKLDADAAAKAGVK